MMIGSCTAFWMISISAIPRFIHLFFPRGSEPFWDERFYAELFRRMLAKHELAKWVENEFVDPVLRHLGNPSQSRRTDKHPPTLTGHFRRHLLWYPTLFAVPPVELGLRALIQRREGVQVVGVDLDLV